MKIYGKSLIPINPTGLKEVILASNPELEGRLEVKFDSRKNVKTTIAKFIPFQHKANELRIYSSAISLSWEDIFKSSDNVSSSLEALLFFTSLISALSVTNKEIELLVDKMDMYRELSSFSNVLEAFPQLKQVYSSSPGVELYEIPEDITSELRAIDVAADPDSANNFDSSHLSADLNLTHE